MNLIVLGLVTWALSVGLTLSFLAEPLLGFAGCELVPGRSIFGEPNRSWLPPGLTCTYSHTELHGTLAEGDEPYVVEPSPLRLLVVALALTLLPICLRLQRLLRAAT